MPETQNDELDTLRRTNAELVEKNKTRTAKIAELEAANTALTAKLSERDATIHGITVGGPLKALAERISNVPELWLEQFAKHFKVEMVDGDLTLLSTDGKPVQKDGKPVPFETKALSDLLTDGDDTRAKAFRAITTTSRASGGAATTTQKGTLVTPKAPAISFGLR